MKEFAKKYLNTFAWGLSATVSATAVIAWGQNINWQLAGISSYKVFPVFGLLAFSLMWTHYIVAGIKAAFNLQDLTLSKTYFEATALVVFGALLLHPGLLVIQLWRDGFGLPPGSYKAYVSAGLIWAVYLGVVSWLAFMAFELRRWYSDKKWWKYVVYANDIAIWAIYIHGLKLGADVAASWLNSVWIFYGFCLAMAFIAIYYKKLFAKTAT